MEEARYRRLYTVWIHLYDILKTGKTLGTETNQWLPGSGGWVQRITTKWHEGNFCGNGNALYLKDMHNCVCLSQSSNFTLKKGTLYFI